MWAPSPYSAIGNGISFLIFYFLPLYCLTLLLYKYQPRYVNPALSIGSSLILYLILWMLLRMLFSNNGFFVIFQFLSIPTIIQAIHLTFTLYAIFYARKTDKQEPAFRKKLVRYIVSFFIGVVFFIASFVIMYVIGYYIALWCYDNFHPNDEDREQALDTMTFYVVKVIFPSIITLLFSQIIYKNHKSFFIKLFHRILGKICKKKS